MRAAGKQPRRRLDGLLALLLFAVFAACILAVLLTGARAYRRLTQRDRDAYDGRTCVQYIATRVRQSDTMGGVAIEDFGDARALVLRERSGFITRVYWYGGHLMELYSAPDAGLSPEDGTKLLEAERVDFSLENGLFQANILAGGTESALRLSLRCGKGA